MGPVKNTHKGVTLLWCLGCLQKVIVSLEGGSLDYVVICSIQLSLNSNQCPRPSRWNTPPQDDVATSLLHCREWHRAGDERRRGSSRRDNIIQVFSVWFWKELNFFHIRMIKVMLLHSSRSRDTVLPLSSGGSSPHLMAGFYCDVSVAYRDVGPTALRSHTMCEFPNHVQST